jgi:hypothetical protein
MNDLRMDHVRGMAPSLPAAMRRARVEQAERSDVIDELRGAELARLEALHEAIKPVLDQVPDDVDMFDAGLAPGDKPRLFIDMIAFVDMARDRRCYRLVQDSRAGRVIIAESERIDTMVDAITNYIARRLVERDKALASAAQPLIYAPAPGSDAGAPGRDALEATPTARAAPRRLPAAPDGQRWRHWFGAGFRFVLEFLGSVALVALLWAAAYGLWTGYLRVLWAAHIGAPPF